MSYSSSVYRPSFQDTGDRKKVTQLKREDGVCPEMWIAAAELPKSHARGKGGTLYEVWVCGVELPELPGRQFTARLATDTVKGRTLTVAAFLADLPRPILLDMIRDNLSDWSVMKAGVQAPRKSWRVSGGTPYTV